MNVYFPSAETDSAKQSINVDRATTAYRTSTRNAERAGRSSFALDISGTVTDNSAYAGHGRTAEEVMRMAGQEDTKARRDYMAVMSNCMSDEDFAKLQEEGFHPGSTEIDTVVTIVDRIKAALVKGGTEVVGYTDTLSDEKLCKITGSESFANELKNQFHDRDIPLTEENVQAITDTYEQIKNISKLSEGSEKYMVENRMEPTPEALYTAQYSAPQEGSRQGTGYYADGTVNGYYAKKPEQIDLEALLPQIVKVIEDAGLEVSEETIGQAQWLIEKGIPLDEEAMQRLHKLETIEFPIRMENYLNSVTAAIADGIPVKKADLTRRETYLEEIRGKRQLEETRLQMSFEANLKLLRSGYQLDTAPVEETVKLLKQLEDQLSLSLTGEEDVVQAKEKLSLFDESMELIQSIRTAPVSFVEQIEPEDTLKKIADTGEAQRRACEKASRSYEELMTAPRKDLGDQIAKAFRNVDDLLDELNLAATEENRRAVRILGYNQMEISEENITKVKEKDTLLTGVIREMKPGRVLQMIRKGINPISMKLEDLDTFLKENKDTADDMESYSRFLYRLEQDHDITEEERSAYIGIYRLMHQIEKNDAAPLGAAMQADMELTLENLLTALRSTKKEASRKLDYRVDDHFGGVTAKESAIESITSQIEKGYAGDTADLYTLLDQAGSEEAQKEYEQELYAEIREAYKAEEDVMQQLSDYAQPITADHLMAMDTLLNASAESFRKMNELLKNKNEKQNFIAKHGEEILRHMNSREETVQTYGKMTGEIQDTFEQEAFDPEQDGIRYSSDIRSMTGFYKQLGLMKSLAREENYEIPIEIDGSLTAINLKVIHNEQEEGRVAITFTSEPFGKTAAEFRLTEQGLSGYCTCEKEAGKALLEEHKAEWQEQLVKEGIQPGAVYFTNTNGLNLKDFNKNQTKEQKSGSKADSVQLYRAAKAFIAFVRQTGDTERKSI